MEKQKLADLKTSPKIMKIIVVAKKVNLNQRRKMFLIIFLEIFIILMYVNWS